MRQAWIARVAGLLAASVLTATSPPDDRMADWLTDGGDAHRTAWQQHETALSPATVKGMTRLWTIHLDNVPRQMHALFPALIAGRVETPTGPKQIAVVAGSSNNLYGIDVEAGVLLWKRHFDRDFTPSITGRPPSTLCPSGLTATPVIAPASAPGRYVVYAVTWDGRLRTIDVATGDETQPPAKFLPPNGKPYALNLSRGVIYTATSEQCGDNVDAVYAFDLDTKRVARFAPNGGGLWGRTGPSIGVDGTIYTPTGDGEFNPRRHLFGQAILGITRQATGALTLKDYFAPPNAAWMTDRDLDMNVTGPVFTAKGRELMAQSSKECRLWLLDTSSLGGADHRTAAYASPVLCNEHADWQSAGVWGAMTTWQDAAGARWVAAPLWGPKVASFTAPIEHGDITHGAVAAFTVVEEHGRPVLAPQWISRDMNRAEPPVVANGVVFGYGAGESTNQSEVIDDRRVDPTTSRIAHSTRAVIYALDAATGAELWSSGDQIASWNHFSGLSIANGRVYIGTYDGNLYCFGLKEAPAVRRRPSLR